MKSDQSLSEKKVRNKTKSSKVENYCVQTSRTCVKDNESSFEFFERKGQTDIMIRFIKVGG